MLKIMKIVSRILARAARLPFSQEYLCLEDRAFDGRLHAYELRGGRVAADVTGTHLFVGYSPLLLAFPAAGDAPAERTLIFSAKELDPGAEPPRGAVVASLQLRLRPSGDAAYALYEGVGARHRMLSSWKQWWIDAHNRHCKKGPGNVFLPGNGYRQVQVAYALPRPVCLVTVEGPGGINVFPTDLHGALPGGQYLVSLRHAGKACAQVLAAGGLLLAHMAPERAGFVYGLGKNHMQEPGHPARFPVDGSFEGLPVPEGAVHVQRLQLESSALAGIHRILRFRCTADEKRGGGGGLAHVHAAYGSWLQKRGFEGNYFPR
jgi:hypothetical protein